MYNFFCEMSQKRKKVEGSHAACRQALPFDAKRTPQSLFPYPRADGTSTTRRQQDDVSDVSRQTAAPSSSSSERRRRRRVTSPTGKG